MPILPGMKAGGYYDLHSSYQRVTVESFAPWIDQAVTGMVLPNEEHLFTVADYGCSEGGNSILAVSRVMEAFRRRRPEQSACGIHSDLPTNNFNRVFANLHDPQHSNYLHERGTRRPHVWSLTAGASFYGPVLPPCSVHVALSFTAVVWMDRVPEIPTPDFISYMKGSPAVQEAFARQAALDLATFYRHRARELAPGGKLLVIAPGSDGTLRCGDGPFNLLNDAGLDMVADGRFDRDRWERFAIPNYFRTVDEMVAPLQHAEGPGAETFVIDRAEFLELPVPFRDRFEQTGDARAYGVEYVGFLRAFSEPVLSAGLAAEARAMDAYYDRAVERLVAEPERYRLRNLETAVLLTRT